jgi:hypothetical protein
LGETNTLIYDNEVSKLHRVCTAHPRCHTYNTTHLFVCAAQRDGQGTALTSGQLELLLIIFFAQFSEKQSRRTPSPPPRNCRPLPFPLLESPFPKLPFSEIQTILCPRRGELQELRLLFFPSVQPLARRSSRRSWHSGLQLKIWRQKGQDVSAASLAPPPPPIMSQGFPAAKPGDAGQRYPPH